MTPPGLPAIDPQPVQLDFEAPVLAVVVDTEEEFDWTRPFSRESTGTRNIPEQDRAHAIFDRLGVVPTYVMDYPVATCPRAVRYFRVLLNSGRAEVGTHCHPWVTPPHDEDVNAYNSFHGNLPADLEKAKIEASTDAVAQAFSLRPAVFKAGRYGVGPQTFDVLKALGYTVDCSFVPQTSYAVDCGPDFLDTPDQPFFTDRSQVLLEVPLTVGFSGRLAHWGRRHPRMVVGDLARKSRLTSIVSRLGLIERARLTPEGFDETTQKRLIRAMCDQGVKVFTLTYHSSSLLPGCTPYVRSEEELSQFLERLESVLSFCTDELDMRFTTVQALARQARAVPGV